MEPSLRSDFDFAAVDESNLVFGKRKSKPTVFADDVVVVKDPKVVAMETAALRPAYKQAMYHYKPQLLFAPPNMPSCMRSGATPSGLVEESLEKTPEMSPPKTTIKKESLEKTSETSSPKITIKIPKTTPKKIAKTIPKSPPKTTLTIPKSPPKITLKIPKMTSKKFTLTIPKQKSLQASQSISTSA